eukprot:TRINITY_DN17514_c0_g1_i2.p1 TRINITY_DN17514_c0_g1~~TRINITY_DN17514_c0_g1_i2.p1  ORF type:complete len:537 (-),score=131.51 TRINITY_DN17514_c0_g1_i2:268-1878(-)
MKNVARASKDPGYKVKNTFLEFSAPEDEAAVHKRRTRSDQVDMRHSPLVVASKSPTASPLLQPVDETRQAMPIDEVDFEMLEEACEDDDTSPIVGMRRGSESEAPIAQVAAGHTREEPAYIVPTTPSPFLHSSFPPQVVPDFPAFGYGGMDMGLPPAFGGEEFTPEMMGDMAGNPYMQGMPFMSPEMMMGYMPYAWNQQCGEQDFSQMAGVLGSDGQQQLVQQQDQLNQEEKSQDASKETAEGEASPADQATDEKAKPSEQPSAWGQKPDHNANQDDWAARKTWWKDDNKGKGKEKGKGKWWEEDYGKGKGKGKGYGKGWDDGASKEDARAAAARAEGAAQGASILAAVKGTANINNNGNNGNTNGANGAYPEKCSSVGPPQRPEGDEPYTTVMLRNIPNKYTREMLVKQLSVNFSGGFDFMYLPIDFKNKCNVGYGFINFRHQDITERFIGLFHGVDVRKCLPGLNSKKIVEVTPARVQGLTENVRRLRNSPVMNQLADHPEWMPLLFNEDGKDEPFPMPDQPLPPVKPRGRNRE